MIDNLLNYSSVTSRLLHQNGLLGISGRFGIDGVDFPGGGGADRPNTGRLNKNILCHSKFRLFILDSFISSKLFFVEVQ